MLSTTDIPEWVCAEGLSGGAAVTDRCSTWGSTWGTLPVSAEAFSELAGRSPLSVVDRVEAPALVLLGASDQRVPPAQGRSWVSALQQVRARASGRVVGEGAPRRTAARPDVTALEFPGEGHSIASLEANAHAQQSAVAWLVARLGKMEKLGEGKAETRGS